MSTTHHLPHRYDMALRYGDTDQQGHINNAVYATLFEGGRVNFLHAPEHSMPPKGCAFVIAEITIKYIEEMRFPGTVEIYSAVSRLGRSSIALEQAILHSGRLCATATSVIVLTDTQTRRSTPMPDAMRSYLQTLMKPEAIAKE